MGFMSLGACYFNKFRRFRISRRPCTSGTGWSPDTRQRSQSRAHSHTKSVQGFCLLSDPERFPPAAVSRRNNGSPPSSWKGETWRSPPVFFRHEGNGTRTWCSTSIAGWRGKTVSENGYNKTIKKVSDKKRSFCGFLAVVGRGKFGVYRRQAAGAVYYDGENAKKRLLCGQKAVAPI